MLISNAKEVRYVNGMNKPHSMKNIPIVASMRSFCRKIDRSGTSLSNVALFAGKRLLINRNAKLKVTRSTSAIIRVAHANPKLEETC